MLKKTLMILLMMVLLPLAALADTIYCTSDDAALLESGNLSETESRIGALNAMFKDAASAAFGTQQELIESIQGYADEDMKAGFSVQILGQNDLYLLCGGDTAASAQISDLPTLKAYLEENEYALKMMRSFQATNADYASMVLMDEMCFDSEMYVDEQEKWDNLNTEGCILVADTAKTLELAEAGYTVLGALSAERTAEYPDLPCAGECDLPVIGGTYYALFFRAGADASPWQAVALKEDAVAAYHLHAPDANASLDTDIENFVDYMTAEGLFFY